MLPLAIPTFFAGLLTFLAPCTLPLVPAYLSFISGAGSEKDQAKQRSLVLKNGLAFVIGFSLIFIIFGTLAGLAGTALAPYRLWLTRASGVFVILFGLFMLGALKLPMLNREMSVRLPAVFRRGTPASSLLLGSAFGMGWTPCVGPILGSVLLLTASTATAAQGAFLLAIFSLGLAIPFVLVALGFNAAQARIARFSKYLNVVSIIGGLFLILIGILLLLNKMTLLISWGYRLLEFINYDQLTNLL